MTDRLSHRMRELAMASMSAEAMHQQLRREGFTRGVSLASCKRARRAVRGGDVPFLQSPPPKSRATASAPADPAPARLFEHPRDALVRAVDAAADDESRAVACLNLVIFDEPSVRDSLDDGASLVTALHGSAASYAIGAIRSPDAVAQLVAANTDAAPLGWEREDGETDADFAAFVARERRAHRRRAIGLLRQAIGILRDAELSNE